MSINNNDNIRIGKYLTKLILSKYKSIRQFCIEFVERTEGGAVGKNDSVQRMANRMNQIGKGNQSVQISDLPYFTEILGVSCEEILSAGRIKPKKNVRLTNYSVACSNDKHKWDEYINSDDSPFLYNDENNKSAVEYAIQLKNYNFLKYLTENNYIWFRKDNPQAEHNFDKNPIRFGTSVQNKREYDDDYFNCRYNRSPLDDRRKLIHMAVENNDIKMLENLKAREICDFSVFDYHMPDFDKLFRSVYYDDELISVLSKSDNEDLISYFSEEFEVNESRCRYGVYLFLPELIDKLLKAENKNMIVVALNNALSYNKSIYQILISNFKSYIEDLEDELSFYKDRVVFVIKERFKYIYNGFGFVGNMNFYRLRLYDNWCITNPVNLNLHTDDILIQELIDEVNELYIRITEFKTSIDAETDRYFEEKGRDADV